MTAPVGPDGVLNLSLPLGKGDANKMARVLVETFVDDFIPTPTFPDRDAWLRFVEQMAGSISDPTFFHHSQGPPEERAFLP